MSRFPRAVALVAALLAWPSIGARAAPAAASPNLVVVVSVDQMRADYIDQFRGQWSRGLKTLLGRGAVFRNARYPYLNTITCAGHATIGTGAFPHRHGMILNAWWDPVQRKPVECTADPAAPAIFYGTPQESPGHSARSIQVPTLAEILRKSLKPPARAVSFAGKARSAIGLVGKGGDLVLWYEGDGTWATSRAFGSARTPLVERVLGQLATEKLIARPWDRVLPGARLRVFHHTPHERLVVPWWSNRFPHPLVPPAGAPPAATPLPPLAAWDRSPMPDEVLLELATAALEEMALGQGMGTDFLALGLSSLDVVGHSFGPRSHEVQDVLVRLDRLLGQLLARLDRRVGRGRYVLALTSDHGVAAHPEQIQAEGQDAGRIPLAQLKDRLDKAIAGEIGPGSHVATILYTDIYLAAGVLEKLRAKAGALERILTLVRNTPGVAAAFSTDQLRDPAAATDPVARAAALSHFPGRSGQLVMVPKPNWLTTAAGTTHGSANEYDQRVPLLLYGAGIRPGSYDRAVTPADVAPTLAALVGLAMPEAEGRPLAEAIVLPGEARRAPRR
jgi:predicted AlkP superfamily pyrophosphatase or phosphodiesterase